jgi:methyltransferase (TIGR00027 family)
VALHRVFGAVSFGMTYHVALRTRALDDALRVSLDSGVKQVVVLGAGLDGRAFRMGELEGITVYEVDHPNTQRDKRERLSKTNLHGIADVTFVPVDFETDDIEVSLVNAGFSRNEPAFWIWEGVTVYLTREAMTSTMRAMARMSARGSRVALTYARPPSQGSDLSHPILFRVARSLVVAGSIVLGRIGESVQGFTDSFQLAEMAEEAGFVVRSDENANDWAERYWPDEPHGPFEWERIAVLERKA